MNITELYPGRWDLKPLGYLKKRYGVDDEGEVKTDAPIPIEMQDELWGCGITIVHIECEVPFGDNGEKYYEQNTATGWLITHDMVLGPHIEYDTEIEVWDKNDRLPSHSKFSAYYLAYDQIRIITRDSMIWNNCRIPQKQKLSLSLDGKEQQLSPEQEKAIREVIEDETRETDTEE